MYRMPRNRNYYRFSTAGIIIFIFLNIKCKSSAEDQYYEISNDIFSIKMNKSFEIKEVNSESLYKGFLISIAGTDTIIYRIGVGTHNLAEIDPEIIYLPNGVDTTNMDLSNVITTNKIYFDIDEYRKQNVKYEIIDGLNAKITFPRKSGDGITGVYFDSLYYGSSSDVVGVVSFHMYGKNLSKNSEDYLLNSFESLKFVKPTLKGKN